MPYIAVLYHNIALERNPCIDRITRGVKMPINAKNLSKEECYFLCNIGFRVQFMRKKKGLSQAQLAEKSGLADSTISHLESTSVYTISLVTLFRIAVALEVEPKALLDFD